MQNTSPHNFAKLEQPKRLQPTLGKNKDGRRGRAGGHLT